MEIPRSENRSSSEVQLFQYHYVTSRFRKLVKNEALAKKIKSFFASYFFTKHATMEFFLGVGDDNHQQLLISEDSIKAIHLELEIYTSSTIPSPSQITDKDKKISYRNVKAIFIDSPGAYNKVIKSIRKHDKEIREKKKLNEMKKSWENARKLFEEKKYLFVAVDVESYERDHSCILEVGWSMFDAKNDRFMDRHFCVSEYSHLRNGQFVPDKKDRFSFGKSVWSKLEGISDEILKDLKEETVKGNVVFIGHDVEMDIKYLKSMKVDVKDDIKPVAFFDTAEMNAARVGKPSERISLGKLLDELDIENYCLHNAGNDAHYTLLLFLELCKLPPEETAASQSTSNSD